jgi:excisionase family DNA binding protein
MEHNMMTIKDVAEYMRLSEQTIQRYVMNKEIPFHKVKKVIRFRFSEIETWINEGGGVCAELPVDDREGDLFTGMATVATGETAGIGTDGKAGEVAANEAEADGEAGETAVGTGANGEAGEATE